MFNAFSILWIDKFRESRSTQQGSKPLILCRRPGASIRSWNVVVHPAAAVGPIQKVVAITQRSFGVLVDRDHDRLNVLLAVPLKRTHAPYIGECFPGRIICISVVPAGQLRSP